MATLGNLYALGQFDAMIQMWKRQGVHVYCKNVNRGHDADNHTE